MLLGLVVNDYKPMNIPLKEAKPCPSCGRPLPAGNLSGLCPACLLAQGAGTDPGGPEEAKRFVAPSVETIARLFPQLEILGLLGAGGMGAVYKARQPVLDRWVALKVLPAGGPNAVNFAERFNREARALARLSHPNIVAVHEFGQVEGLHFFLMEFVDGTNLRQLEQAERLSPRVALQLIPQICDALQYAHDEGVVHRDIKPENVLVDRKGRVKIADFGLAKILGRDPQAQRLTLEGQVMGTPHYMAPEQVEHPLSVDHRADIYSLGVVFYEMLTGDLPIGKFSPPSRKVQVDVRFDEIVLRALENDPARRYQHVSEVKSQVATVTGTAAQNGPRPAGPNSHQGEPDGTRVVDWKRAGPNLAIAFGQLVLGSAFLSAATGNLFVGWLGIAGWQSVVARSAIGGLLVAAGIRRALKQLPNIAGPLAPGGTAIVQPKAPWWRTRALVLTSLMLLAAASTLVLQWWGTPYLAGMQKPESFKAVEQARLNPETGIRSASLPGGGLVELLALSDSSGTGVETRLQRADLSPEELLQLAAEAGAAREWWRPDGTRLTNTTFAVQGPADMTAPGARKVDLAFRILGMTTGADAPEFDSDTAALASSGGEVLQDGQRVLGGWPLHVAWPASASVATIRVGCGLEPWRTVIAYELTRHSVSQTPRLGDPRWSANINHSGDNGKDTGLTVVLGPQDKNWRLRIVAVDRYGVEHLSRTASGTALETSTTWTLTFPNLTMDRLKEIRLQVQKLHWVEFRDVPLRGKGTAQTVRPPAEPSDLRAAKAHLAELRVMFGDEDTSVRGAQARIAELERMVREEPQTPADVREAKAHLAELRMTFGEGHSSVQSMRARITELERLSREESTALADLREAKTHLAELRVNFGEEHPSVQQAQARIRELQRLTREEPAASAELREAKAHLAELRVSFGEQHPEVQQALARIKVLEGK